MKERMSSFLSSLSLPLHQLVRSSKEHDTSQEGPGRGRIFPAPTGPQSDQGRAEDFRIPGGAVL